ncbi:FISUMP domain-containing protein [Mucilaginibacter sp. Mucisp86]|uniref:FISUMP domain-containing protein n=1 Tax=Mucilaginibacter sp. Mucisp86 TaxID=3243060 RepID=UPI0039B561A6
MQPKLLIIFIVAVGLLGCTKEKTKTPDKVVPPVKINYGSVVVGDTTYKTIEIGTQVWMAESYRGFGSPLAIAVVQGHNTNLYYGLYMTEDYKLPAGWRVPTIADYNKLSSNVTKTRDSNGNYLALKNDSARKLTSPFLWKGTDGTNTLHFNGEPSGYYLHFGPSGFYLHNTDRGYYVIDDKTSDKNNNKKFYCLSPDYAGIVTINDKDSVGYALLRLVKDK